MAASKKRLSVTCPCGRRFSVRRSRIGKSVNCNGCGESLLIRDVEGPETGSILLTPSQGRGIGPVLAWVIVAHALAAAIWMLFSGLRGPEFLFCYIGLFTESWIAAEILRTPAGRMTAVLVPLGVFLATGVLRIVLGLQSGMHRFELLVFVMLIGTVLMLMGAGKLFPYEGSKVIGCGPIVVSATLSLIVGVMLVDNLMGWITVGLITPAVLGLVCLSAKGTSGRTGGTASGFWVSSGSCGSTGTGGGCGGGGCGGGGCGGCGG